MDFKRGFDRDHFRSLDCLGGYDSRDRSRSGYRNNSRNDSNAHARRADSDLETHACDVTMSVYVSIRTYEICHA